MEMETPFVNSYLNELEEKKGRTKEEYYQGKSEKLKVLLFVRIHFLQIG